MTGCDSRGRKDRRDQESLERRHFGYCLRLDFLVLVEAGLGYAMSDNERPAQEFNCSASSSRMNEQTCTKKKREVKQRTMWNDGMEESAGRRTGCARYICRPSEAGSAEVTRASNSKVSTVPSIMDLDLLGRWD